MRAFGSAISGIGAKLAGLGAIAWAPLMGAAKVFADTGSDLLVMSQRMGITVEALAELRSAAKKSGVEVEDLESGFRHMNRMVDEARQGSAAATETLRRLGLTANDLKDLTPDKQFELLTERLAGVADQGTRSALTMAIFGRHGSALLPIINQGVDALRQFRQEAIANGRMTTEQAQDARALQMGMDGITAATKAALITIGGQLAPALTDLARWISSNIRSLRGFIQQNKAAFVAIAAVSGAVVALGAGLLILGKVFAGVALAISIVSAVVSAAGALIGGTVGMVGALAAGIVGLLNPFGLVVIAFDAIRSYALTQSGALATLGSSFRTFGSIAVTTWAGISDAIATNDWAGAMQMAWAGLRAAWVTGIATLRTLWRDFSGWFADSFHSAVGSIAVTLDSLGNRLDTYREAIRQDVETGGPVSSATPWVIGALWGPLAGQQAQQQAQIAAQTGGARQRGAELDAQFAARLRAAIEEWRRANPGMSDDAMPEHLRRGLGWVRGPNAVNASDVPFGSLGRPWPGAMSEQEQRARENQRRAEREADEEQIRAAQQELADARAEMARRRVDREWALAEAGGPQQPTPDANLPAIQQRIEAKGTFNAFAVAGLGASSVTDRIASATEQTARNTARMAQPQFT